MSAPEPPRLSTERIILIVVSCLLIIAVAYIAIGSLLGRVSEPVTEGPPPAAPIEPTALLGQVEEPSAPEAPPMEPTAESPPAADVTPTPRRLAIPPTPTPFQVKEDDPRAILDLTQPDGTDYLDEITWYDYDSEGSAAYWVEGGKLYGKDYNPEDKSIYWSFTNPQSGNTYAEISATNGDCVEKDSVGLVIRVQGDKSPSGYALEVACDGTWRLRYLRGPDKPIQDLIEWTSSQAIVTGPFATNRLGLWGYQGKFYMFINNELVGEDFHGDYYMTYGYFAAYVRAERTYDLISTFDDFAYWHIPFIP